MNVAIAGLDPYDLECLINHSMSERGSRGVRIGPRLPPDLATIGRPRVAASLAAAIRHPLQMRCVRVGLRRQSEISTRWTLIERRLPPWLLVRSPTSGGPPANMKIRPCAHDSQETNKQKPEPYEQRGRRASSSAHHDCECNQNRQADES